MSEAVLEIPITVEETIKIKSDVSEALIEFGRSHTQEQHQLLADFVGCDAHKTIRSWINGQSEPGGVFEIRARTILECIGYKFNARPQPIMDFSRLLGFGIVTFEDAAALLGITHKSILCIVTGRAGTSNERLGLIEALVEDNQCSSA
jgi:hypothetical protein